MPLSCARYTYVEHIIKICTNNTCLNHVALPLTLPLTLTPTFFPCLFICR